MNIEPKCQFWETRKNVDGEVYLHCREKIMSICGFNVDTEIEAFGRTEDEVESRLEDKRSNLVKMFLET